MDNTTLTTIFAGIVATLYAINTFANTPYGKAGIDYLRQKEGLKKAIKRAFKEGYVDDGNVPITETEFVPLKTKKDGQPVINKKGERMYAIRFWAIDHTTLDALFPGTKGVVAQDLIEKARSQCSAQKPCIFSHLSDVITPDMRKHNDNPDDPIENHILRQFIRSNSESLNSHSVVPMPKFNETYDYQTVSRVLIDEEAIREDRVMILHMPEWQKFLKAHIQQTQIVDPAFIKDWNKNNPDQEIDFDFDSDFDPSVQHLRYHTIVAAGEELKRQTAILKSSSIRVKTGIIPTDDPSANVSEPV